jgi:esterase/lipase superfamily enzyme
MFLKSRWRSERLGCEATLARWGHFGQPVLVFPTAGGDAEEIERWQVIRVLEPLINEGKIKIYSCDSVAGGAWFGKEGTPAHRMWMQNQFHQYVKHEVVPAIRMDCKNERAEIWAAGASIGAFHSVAVVCRFPDLFVRALAMSGTYNLMRFIEVNEYTEDYFVSSPLQFVPTLAGKHLDVLRTREIVLASGDGRAENMGESWAMANTLGKMGIPNRVDPWGPEWHHDWPTWRAMLPKYFGEWTRG